MELGFVGCVQDEGLCCISDSLAKVEVLVVVCGGLDEVTLAFDSIGSDFLLQVVYLLLDLGAAIFFGFWRQQGWSVRNALLRSCQSIRLYGIARPGKVDSH